MEWIFILLFLLVVYTYIGYGLILWLLVKQKELLFKPKEKELPLQLPEVAFVIAAYNEEDVVHQKMDNCKALDYPEELLHICWVTDGSTDGTNKLLGDYSNITLFFEPPRQGKSSAINRVMPFIDKPITIFTDANAMVNPQAIMEIVREFTDPKVGCVAGEKRVAVNAVQNATAGEGIYWKYESKLKELDYRLYSAVGAAGELFAVRTKLFITLPADTLLDDFVMSMKIADEGYKIAYSKEAYATEQASLNMNEENKRKVRIAAGGMQSIGRLVSFLNPFKHPILSFQYISHRVLRWTITPIALFLLFPLNVCFVMNGYHTYYTVILVLQILFYLAALGGWLLSLKQIKNKYLFIPFYFVTMNVNVIRGFNYLRKTKGSGIWERAKRAN